MASLHQVTIVTKKALAGVIGAIVAIILLVLLFQLGVQLKNTFFPTPPPPPTVRFGKLPSPSFPQSTATGTYTYTLNTISGTLPTLPDRATVYTILQPQPDLLALDNAKAIMSQNQFTNDPTTLSDSIFQWQNANQAITYNIVTNDFSFTTTYLNNQDVLAANNLPNQQEAIDQAIQFFNNFSTNQTDIDTSKTQTSLLRIQNNQLTPATSLSDTQVIRVDFFQQDINSLSVYYPQYPKSLMYALIAGGADQPQVVEAGFTHKIVITDDNATYPIKTAQQAFNELKSGKAYIANYDGTSSNITIRNVVLGYYLGSDPQSYALPIIVFKGDNNFYAYVNAVTDAWVNK